MRNTRHLDTTSSRATSFVARLAVAAFIGRGAGAQAVGPRVQFIAVEKDVKLEVIDWGGSGRPVVLLAGNTQTAHSFDDFAPTLAATNHVYAVTRRGFGASSAPQMGYEADRLADDVLAVLDSLRLDTPLLVGHSLAGQELSSIGSRHPERVAGLVYLDAGYSYAYYDTARGNFDVDRNELRRHLDSLQIVGSKGAFAEMERLFAHLLETDLPRLERDLRGMRQDLPAYASGPVRPLMPPLRSGIARAIADGTQPYTSIRAPVLALYAIDATVPADIASDSVAAQRWLLRQSTGATGLARVIPSARIVMIPHASHAIFASHPALVLGEMREFMKRLPAWSR